MKKYIINKRKLFICISSAFLLLIASFAIYSFVSGRNSLASEDKVWDGVSIATSFSGGNGSLDNPYVIKTSPEFLYFKQLIEGANSLDYQDKYYILDADLDFGNHSFSSIGTLEEEKIFQGHFDGNGHTLRNIKLTATKNGETSYFGLFSKVVNASIQNLNIDGLDITASAEDKKVVVGTIAGEWNTVLDENSQATIVSSLKDISIYQFNVNLGLVSDNTSVVGGLSSKISSYVDINNIYLNGKMIQNGDVPGIYGVTTDLNSSVNNLLCVVDDVDLYKNVSKNVTTDNNYSFHNGKYYLGTEEVTLDDIVAKFNLEDNGNFYWSIYEDHFVLKEKEAVVQVPKEQKSFSFFAYSRSDIPTHASGIADGVVYVNDLEATWNYYMGLNYTEISSGNLPTYSNRYGSHNLVEVAISYSGEDINDSSLVGHVSPTEMENKYVYYRYYPVENNNITIELIDNPFSARPKNKGFIGWATAYPGAVLSFDEDIYTRYVTIPVTGMSKISIEMNAIWGEANIQTNVDNINSFDTAGMRNLPEYEVCEESTYPVDVPYFDPDKEYYEKKEADAYSYYGGYYLSGSNYRYSSSRMCFSWGGCEYYGLTSDETMVEGKQYYFFESAGGSNYRRVNATFLYHRAGETGVICTKKPGFSFDKTGNAVGFYYKKNVGTDDRSLYYNQLGQNCSKVSCSNGNTYKLLQYSDDYAVNFSNYSITDYYYLVTRDMNILVYHDRSVYFRDLMTNRPYTLTSSYDGSPISSNYSVNVSTTELESDMVIENINIRGTSGQGYDGIDTSNTLDANAYNLKIGRNVENTNGVYNNIFTGIYGTSTGGSSNSNLDTYRVMVETGVYNYLVTAYSTSRYSRTYYIHGIMVYGNDYDRVSHNDSNLIVYFNALASASSSSYNNSDKTVPSSEMIIKSGMYGMKNISNKLEHSDDSAFGVYVGGRSTTHYSNSLRTLMLWGGDINALNGGPCVENGLTSNSTALYMLGGKVRTIYGGAARTATYGNRIVSITGGEVGYSVSGGSNAYDGGNSEGQLNGHTLVYIGGNAVIGDTQNTGKLFNSEVGGVFGAGNGVSSATSAGRVFSSHVIVDGDAIINGNVYGGGNYGTVGFSDTASKDATIDIFGGTLNRNIYGGGNNRGSGTTSIFSDTYINYYNGTIQGSIFGGSRTNGIVYGNSTVNVYGGNVLTDVYGGGEGNSTFVQRNINVSVGNSSVGTVPTIRGNVYGGSAFGTVNGTTTSGSSTYKTNVTVNKGTIVGDAFGGAKGSTSYTPYVLGDITVTVHDGSIGRVFGGFDVAGKPGANDVVYLNGGTIGNAFGGGNKTSQNATDIRLQGAIVTNLYGGSNESGTVTTSNVLVSSGTVTGIYGGNNIAGSTTTTHVNVNGGTINGNIYGGGFEASSGTSNVTIQAVTVNDVFGGGKQAGIKDTATVTLNGSSAKKVFGGSDESGDVSISKVTMNGKSAVSVYGGNNLGGVTSTSNVTIHSGEITDVYGGGDSTETGKSNITINDGTIINVYGGGNGGKDKDGNDLPAGLDVSNVSILGGTITNVYGGSNASGNLNTSNVVLGKSNIEIAINSSVKKPDSWMSSKPTYANVTVTLTNHSSESVDNWDLFLNVPSGEVFSNYSNSNIVVDGDIFKVNSANRYYGTNTLSAGGSYSFSFEALSDVPLTSFEITGFILDSTGGNGATISNVYGGNNRGGVTSSTNVYGQSGVVGTIYGGGNLANVVKTNVLLGKVQATDVYGGGNAAGVSSDTLLSLNHSSILNSIYGGGNEGVVSGSTDVLVADATILGNAYAGGNGSTAVVKKNSFITIEGLSVVGSETTIAPHAGCVFGSGNAAATGVESTSGSKAKVNIVGGTIYGNVYGGPKMSTVYGTTDTNIGSTAVGIDGLKISSILIKGTVFGGGESNANGSENYDWTFISVTEGIHVNINGDKYTNSGHDFVINGSIFGSGNASSSAGSSVIDVKDLGTMNKPNRSISIQRANSLVIDHSVVELEGTTDRTNEYSDIKYSFNMIDKMIIKNGTTLLLQHNANMLKELYSGVDVNGELVPAEVTIDKDNKKITKNVDNRIYMAPNQNLNVTINQAATAYGKVTGMSFFGMYNSYHNGSYRYGLYEENIGFNSTANAGLVIVGGSYVLGLHSINHDITKDGFYSNFLDDEYTEITVDYIDPAPIGDTGYRWVIGLAAINYNLTLTASKYSSLGTYELQMIDFTAGDTIFSVVGFNSEGLSNGVTLVDSNLVPRIAKTKEEANKILGLSIKSETQEWTSYNTTKLLSEDNGKYTGDLEYRTDSRKLAPSLMFYFYHAKNITLADDLGTVVIMLQAAVPVNQIDYKVQLVTITVDLTAKNIEDVDSYDASITYDRRYEMPSATSVNITNQSQFTAYYSLVAWADDFNSVYGKNNDNFHVLTTNNPLPVHTMITMLDFGANTERPEYYYYEITPDIYNDSLTQLEKYNEITYRLSSFIKMGSTSSNNTYKDKDANIKYYSEDIGLVDEEFIFIFDFKDCEVTGDHLGNTMLFELRNTEERSIYNVLGIRQNLMVYNTYESSNAVLSQSVQNMDGYLYHDIAEEINYATAINYNQTANRESVIDTNYESRSMGLNVAFYDNDMKVVSSSLLSGTSFKIGNQEYFADSDGVFRIKLAGKVSNLNRKISLFTNSDLPPGTYTLRFTLFASDDGLHNSDIDNSITEDFTVTVISAGNSIAVKGADEGKIVDGSTSLNLNGEKFNDYIVKYGSKLTNPNIRVEVFKRDISEIDSTLFQSVPFDSLFTNNLTVYNGNEVLLDMGASKEKTFKFDFKEELISGTYKIVFKLYDNDQLIDDDVKYVIVKKKSVE